MKQTRRKWTCSSSLCKSDVSCSLKTVPAAGVCKIPKRPSALLWSTLTTWSVWITAPTATWPAGWNARWKVWVTEPGWTVASVTPLHLSPGLSALSTTPSPTFKAQETAYTSWTRSQHSRKNQHPPCRAWWRNGEAAAHSSRVGTPTAVQLLTTTVLLMSAWRTYIGNVFSTFFLNVKWLLLSSRSADRPHEGPSVVIWHHF